MQIQIERLYDWLPTYGESAVQVNFDGSNLNIDVFYEIKSLTGEIQFFKKRIEFISARFFSRNSFPGYDIVIEQELVNLEKPLYLGSLTQFRTSKYLESCETAYQAISGIKANAWKHYYVQFLSENCSFHVIARDVEVLEATLINELP